MRPIFKKGALVAYAIKHSLGTLRGRGIVIADVPVKAKAGNARLTVRDADGMIRRPFPSQCKVTT